MIQNRPGAIRNATRDPPETIKDGKGWDDVSKPLKKRNTLGKARGRTGRDRQALAGTERDGKTEGRGETGKPDDGCVGRKTYALRGELMRE